MYLVSWHLCYGLGVSVIWLLDPSLPEWFVGKSKLMNRIVTGYIGLTAISLIFFHSYSWGPKTFKTNGLHRNPVMNVLLPLNLLIESPLPKLLAVTIALSLFFFFLFLPESASSSCFGGSRTKTNGFSDVTWSRSWLREWWLIANLTYRGCPITPEIWSMVILWIEYLKLNLGLKYYQDVT